MIDVNEHNLDMTIELEVTDTITITVNDGDDTPSAIEGAKVTIGETEKTTESNGQVTFTEMTYDDYDVTVTANGYEDENETIQFRSNHKSFTISLTASGGEESDSVTLTILDNTYNAPVVGAVVVVYDVDESVVDPIIPAIYADNNGQVTFNIADGTYFLQVSASNYDQIGEEVTFEENHRNLTYKLTRQ